VSKPASSAHSQALPADIDPDTLAIMKAMEEEESRKLAEQLQNDLYSGNEDAIRDAMGGG